jgi:hypothetical protein
MGQRLRAVGFEPARQDVDMCGAYHKTEVHPQDRLSK